MFFESEPLFHLLRSLIIIIGTLGMHASVTIFKPTLKRNLLLLCVYIGYCFLLSAILIPMFGFLLFIRIAPFCILVPGICIYYMVADMPLFQHIFTASTQSIISFYVSASITLLNIRLGSSPFTHIISQVFAYLVVILLEAFFLHRVYLRIVATIKQEWRLFSIISCALLVLTLSFAYYPVHYTESKPSTVLLYTLGAVIIIIYCAIFYFLKVTDDLSIQERNREILDLQVQNIKKSTADSKRKAEIAKQSRQDSFLLLYEIADFAKEKNWNAILETVDKETKKSDASAFASYCNDPFLNATLDSYLGRAKNSGIAVETHFNLPTILPAFSTEFSICLANALENAIKACEKLPKNKRQLIVKCTGEPKLMFKVENTYKGKIAFTKDGVPISSAKGHGIGTRSIIAFCEKHDALYSFKAEDGWFQVTVAL